MGFILTFSYIYLILCSSIPPINSDTPLPIFAGPLPLPNKHSLFYTDSNMRENTPEYSSECAYFI